MHPLAEHLSLHRILLKVPDFRKALPDSPPPPLFVFLNSALCIHTLKHLEFFIIFNCMHIWGHLNLPTA